MHPSALLVLAWLPVVLLYTDLLASALTADDPVQVQPTPPPSTDHPAPPPPSTDHPASNERSVRFYSVNTAGGSLYVRHLICQALLNCFQVAGGAVIETARDFATCANTAEKNKKNVFHYATGVCTTYAAMPPSALLPPCSGVGDAVVYVVKAALNSATLPEPKLTNLELTSNDTSISASWSVQDRCNMTHGHTVSLSSVSANRTTLTVSTAGSSVSTVTVTTPGVSVTVSNGTAFEFGDAAPCTTYSVTVTPQDACSRAVGTSVTAETTTLPVTTASFVNSVYESVTLHNITVKWNFLDCGLIAAYNLSYSNQLSHVAFTILDKSITSVTLLGMKVCTVFERFVVSAVGYDNSTLATSKAIVINGDYIDGSLYIAHWPGQNACLLRVDGTEKTNFSAAVDTCTAYRGELFRYGRKSLQMLLRNGYGPEGWVDLQYSPVSGDWVWGDGEVEAMDSDYWISSPDPGRGHCAVFYFSTDYLGLQPKNCSHEAFVTCFSFY